MPIHASIHDVSPAFTQEIDDALALCHEVGAKPALLVVPNFHGTWPLARYPKFCERLRALQADGHEIYLHGFFHKAGMDGAAEEAGRPGRVRRLFAQKVVSAGEAEFADIGWKEGDARLDEGESILAAAGLRIDGFVAPAWSMASWVLTMLRERGYRYTEDHFHVYDPKMGTTRRSLVLNFASRTPARLWSSVAFCRVARPARRVFPARIALHPGDMRKEVLRREAKDLLAWGRGDYVGRGADLFA
jgi:predicted deacetylase